MEDNRGLGYAILILLSLVAGIVAIVGLFMFGINITQRIFDVGGTYESAITGLLIYLIGRIVCKITCPRDIK